MLRRQPNILIVLGEAECSCLQEHLQGMGDITTVSSLDQALLHLKSEDFDVVFSAWDIQGESWEKLLGALRSHGMQLPIVVYYHCGGEAEWMQALEAGAFDLLAPPFDRTKLAAVLEHAVESGRRSRQLA